MKRDVYTEIISNIENKFIEKDKITESKYVKKIIDRYITLTLESLYIKGKIKVTNKDKLYLKAYPIAYLTKGLARRVLFSSRYPRITFKVFFKCSALKKNKFSFSTLKKLENDFKRKVLDTDNVYSLIKAHEKGII